MDGWMDSGERDEIDTYHYDSALDKGCSGGVLIDQRQGGI